MNVRTTTLLAIALLALSACSGRGANALPAAPASLPMTSGINIHANAAARTPMFMMPTPNYYDDGFTPSIAFVKNDTLVEEHVSSNGYLWYHVGVVNRASVSWGAAQQYDDGADPSVAGDGKGGVLEVHRGGQSSDQLYYRTGTEKSIIQVDWNKINGNDSTPYAKGYRPAVAFSGPNVVVETHSDASGLGSWSVGKIAAGKLTWFPGGSFAGSFRPTVAANARGNAIELERDATPYQTVDGLKYYHLAYRVGHFVQRVSWDDRHVIDATSTVLIYRNWSVSLDDAGNVIVLYDCDATTYYAGTSHAYGWCTLTGKLESDNLVHWVSAPILAPPMHYFTSLIGLGSESVAITHNAKLGLDMAVGVADQGFNGLFFATTLLSDRSNWMGDRLETSLKGKTLRQIVFPASHDAGMYTGSEGKYGVAQSQNFYDQLTGGQRYFDLRVDPNLNAWHGALQGQLGYITGASIRSILDDVKKYMQEGHREVVILKFSHWTYNFWDSDVPYTKLRTMIDETLKPWLYDNPAVKKGTVRLADIPLSSLIPKDHGIVLPVMDLPANIDGTGSSYIYFYRDWETTIDKHMEFTVYDQFADAKTLSTMESDQLTKFYNFNGKMKNFPSQPCDLFLLSWTITPAVAIRASAAEADATLIPVMTRARANTHGFVPNILFVDFYSWADPADLAIAENTP